MDKIQEFSRYTHESLLCSCFTEDTLTFIISNFNHQNLAIMLIENVLFIPKLNENETNTQSAILILLLRSQLLRNYEIG